MNLENLTLTEAAGLIRARSVSPVEYVQALLNRIEGVDSHVKAWVTVDFEGAIREARACESEALRGDFRGPLHGIPLGVKDIIYTRGLRTTLGSQLFKDFIPTDDAIAIANLKRHGAIILGKTVTTEFATFDPGPTHNPWNLGHTPGGSSSGSAAAVAARMVPGTLGSQTVGSIGRPAAYCGIAGLVPTQARVSRKGVFPVGWSLDHVGCFARSTADLKLLLEGLSLERADAPVLHRRLKLGIVQEFFYSNATAETRKLHEAILRKIQSGGVEVAEVRVPEIFESASAILMTIMRAEMASAHKDIHRNYSTSYRTKLRGLVETGMLLDAGSYLRARRLRRIYQSEMLRLFDGCDLLISPGAKDAAPEGLGYTGDPGFSGPWTLADFPTVTLPHGLASNGMPVAIQLSAPPMQESLLFDGAQLVEEIVGFSAAPPALS
jgi:aspartyl-tRNA(Asn)/glutamyl-tRNA(Gln) amidotransferase subunit A